MWNTYKYSFIIFIAILFIFKPTILLPRSWTQNQICCPGNLRNMQSFILCAAAYAIPLYALLLEEKPYSILFLWFQSGSCWNEQVLQEDSVCQTSGLEMGESWLPFLETLDSSPQCSGMTAGDITGAILLWRCFSKTNEDYFLRSQRHQNHMYKYAQWL